MNRVLSVVALATFATPALGGELLPLQPGDELVYGVSGPIGGDEQLVVTVDDTLGSWWQHRTDLLGLGPTWVSSRVGGDTTWIYTPARGTELLIRDGVRTGEAVKVQLGGCNTGYEVLDADADVRVPAGRFFHAVHVRFDNLCADGGLDEAWFAPGVGLVRWTELSFAGVVTTELLSGRVGRTLLPLQQGLAVSGSFEEHVVWLDRLLGDGPTLDVSIAVTNHDLDPVELLFTSGQEYDIVLRDDQGDVVMKWSDDKGFTDPVYTKSIGAGETLAYRDTLVLEDLSGVAIPAGSYTVEMVITSSPEVFVVRSPLEIRLPLAVRRSR